MRAIETDYLVVGAGASGMSFVDTLIDHSDADVVIVDRRHRPGGHWNDDYPFLRLHQPSAWYGVNSTPLGRNRIDESGSNAGFYERATAAEVRDYYGRVLDERMLPSGQVRFLGLTDYDGTSGEHRVTSRLTGETTTVRVRRKLVDATYIETTIPSRHTPSFSVEDGARLVTPNDLVEPTDAGSGYTVIGAGKTSMDTCCWLIEQGMAPEDIRWIRPRDPWTIDRASTQPLERVGSTVRLFATILAAATEAEDMTDLFVRLEAQGGLLRLDPDVEPAVLRGVILSEYERVTLRRIESVVRLGRVRHIGTDRIELEEGSIPTDAGRVHVDCTAPGLGTPPTRPIFEPDRITPQRILFGLDPFSPALVGVVEATRDSGDEKNRLCPPNDLTGEARDFPKTLLVGQRAQMACMNEPEVGEWIMNSRLSFFQGALEHLTDPADQSAFMSILQNMTPAIENLKRIVAGTTCRHRPERSARSA
ncbi:MAG: NAD(P)-binding protein [Actinomycetota bacterium]